MGKLVGFNYKIKIMNVEKYFKQNIQEISD